MAPGVYAPGYGYTPNDGDILESGTFVGTVTFTSQFAAVVDGRFLADPGSLQPPGWPAPVDFSAANPLIFTGTYRGAPGIPALLVGQLTTVPEPTSFGLAAVCLGGLAVRTWRKRRAV